MKKTKALSIVTYTIRGSIVSIKIFLHLILFCDRNHEVPYGLTAVPSLLRTGLQ